MNIAQGTKRKSYSIQQKQEVIDFHNSEPLYTQRQLSSRFNMPLTVINDVLKNADIIKRTENKNVKRVRTTFKTQDMDSKLFEWFMMKRNSHFTVTDDILKNMALKLAEKYEIDSFNASSGWIYSFKKRHNIMSKAIVGEEGLVDDTIICNFTDILAKKLLEYDPRNVFNCDETGLFYKCTRNRSLTIKNTDRTSGKFFKERITLLFCVNMIGGKLKPLMIGSSKNPHGFKNLNFKKIQLSYDSSKKAWMTLNIFCTWLEKLNHSLIQEQRKILLIMDNAPVHPIEVDFSNIEILFLPSATTSKIQALDQGIILSFKKHYKKLLNRKIFFECENTNTDYYSMVKKIKLIDAVHLTLQAWDSVSSDVIQNCFQKSLKNSHIDLSQIAEIPEDNDFPAYEPLECSDEHFIQNLDTELTEAYSQNESEEDDTSLTDEIIMTPYEAYLAVMKLQAFYLENIPEEIHNIYTIKEQLLNERKSRNLNMLDFVTRTKRNIE